MRRREILHGGATGKQPIRARRQGGAGDRQIAQQIIQQQAQISGRNIASRRHINPVTRQRALVCRNNIIAGQGGNRFNRAITGAAIGVCAECPEIESIPGKCFGVFFIRPKPGQNLPPHAVYCVLVKTWGNQRLTQQSHRFGAVFGQEPGRNPDRIVAGPKAEFGRQPIAGGGKSLRVQIAGTFLDQRGHQIDRPALARRIQRCAAAKLNFKGDKGNACILHQPCGDAAGRGDRFNLDLGLQRKGQHHKCQCQTDHCAASSFTRYPVTARRLSNTSFAAAITSSTVTAARTSGHVCTSATLRPIANPSP